MKLTRDECTILMHSIDSGCIPEVLAEEGFSYSHVQSYVDHIAIEIETKRNLPEPRNTMEIEVTHELVDGNTALICYKRANFQIAAKSLEIKISGLIGKQVRFRRE